MNEDSPVPGVPFALHAHDSAEYKQRFRIVRTDFCADPVIDNPHLYKIISADEQTGECALDVGGESKTLSFGPGGMKIVVRARR